MSTGFAVNAIFIFWAGAARRRIFSAFAMAEDGR